MDGSPARDVMDFDRIIAPVGREVFFSEHYERSHLAIHRNAPDYFSDLLDIADIDQVLTGQVLHMADLNLVNSGSPVDKREIALTPDQVDPVRVARQFADGATIVLPHLHRRLPRLAAFCRSLETAFSCNLQTNIYLTPDNAQGFKTHYDSHDVLVLQVAGTKTWRIYESALKLPLRSQAFSPEGFEPGAMIDEFVLHPGDTLYVPRGVVHDAIATETTSLHITTGLLARRWVDLLMEAVAEQGLQDPEFRASLPPGHANDGFDRAAARATFDRLLARVVERADADRALDSFDRAFRDGRRPVVQGHFLQTALADSITPDTNAGVRPDLIARIRAAPAEDDAVEDEGDVVLDVYGAEVAFPAYAEASLRDAMARDTFRVADLAGDLDDAGKVTLVRRLVREGVLRILS